MESFNLQGDIFKQGLIKQGAVMKFFSSSYLLPMDARFSLRLLYDTSHNCI